MSLRMAQGIVHPHGTGGGFAAARRLLFSGSRRGRLILVSGMDVHLLFKNFEPSREAGGALRKWNR